VRVLRAIPTDSLRLFVFDLDGTLIDSRADLAQSINAMLVRYDRHPLPEEVIAGYIGDGASVLVRRALGDPDDESFVTEALSYFLTYYREHKLDFTYVYDGVHPSLRALQNALSTVEPRTHQTLGMAVLTNKPIGPSQAICDALGLSPFFFQIYGGNSFHTKKPDPLGLITLMQEAGVTPAETVLIGDSDVDVLTARNAGTWVVGCTFGLAPHTLEAAPPDVLVDHASDWPRVLLGPQSLSRSAHHAVSAE
jgi:phosphoglycolate phosphatase